MDLKKDLTRRMVKLLLKIMGVGFLTSLSVFTVEASMFLNALDPVSATVFSCAALFIGAYEIRYLWRKLRLLGARYTELINGMREGILITPDMEKAFHENRPFSLKFGTFSEITVKIT